MASNEQRLLEQPRREEKISGEPQEREASSNYINQGNLWRDVKLIFGLMLTYNKRIQPYLRRCDQARTDNCIQFIKHAPGNKTQQLVFCYYLQKSGFLSAFIVALFYPLIPSIAFWGLAFLFKHFQWSQNIYVSYSFDIIMIGIRCSIITYLMRYSLHFPEQRYYWINYIAAIFVGLLFIIFNFTKGSSNGFMALYFLSIMLAYYRKAQTRDSETVIKQKEQEKQIRDSFQELRNLPRLNGKLSIILLISMFVIFWILGKYGDEEQYGHLKQLFVVGMMNFSEESVIFFFTLAFNTEFLLSNEKNYIANLFSFGVLLPGLNLKSFFLLLQGYKITTLILSYLALHLPSLLLMCVYINFTDKFLTLTWKSIKTSIQYVSNGLVLITVFRMMQQESCHYNIIIFTGILIFIITKLYKLYQFISALLAIFLVTSRVFVLHFSHKVEISKFLCYVQDQ